MKDRRLEKRDDGTTVLIRNGRVLATYYDGCAVCEREKAKMNAFFPPHAPNRHCRSGWWSHCTCDTCF